MVNDHCWQDETRRFFLPTHQRAVGYVFQEPSLFAHLSVHKNLVYGLQRISLSQRRVAFDEAVELLGIKNLLHRDPHKLSGGERQRVAIARALLTSPQLLLMDEPLAALDMRSKADILPYLEKLHEMLSIPILYVTHALEEVMRLADTLIIVEQGQIVNYGSLSDMLTRLDLPFAHVREAGVVIQAYVVEYDEQFQLIYLDFCGERLSLPATERMPLGQQVRISINARDVSLALENEVQSSILNIFKGEIVAIAEEKSGQLLVKLEVKGNALLARITKKSAFLLNLQCGMNVYVRVKSIGLI
jgi:molybdate transport system ATP-binding protein